VSSGQGHDPDGSHINHAQRPFAQASPPPSHTATTRPAHAWARDDGTTAEESGSRRLSERDRQVTLGVPKEKWGRPCNANAGFTPGAGTWRRPNFSPSSPTFWPLWG